MSSPTPVTLRPGPRTARHGIPLRTGRRHRVIVPAHTDHVVVVPGLMGSELGGRNGALWLDIPTLVRGDLMRLSLSARGGHRSRGVLFFYGPLREVIARCGFRVTVFHYDWRRSVWANGRRLKARLDGIEGHVHLVAHSMGGLLARAALAQGAANVRKLVMLGTPNHGAPGILAGLRGTNGVMRSLGALDLQHDAQRLARKLVGTFPGVYEMLPDPARVSHDFFERSAWAPRGNPPIAALLSAARGVKARLAPARSGVYLIAGVDHETIVDARPHADGHFAFELSRSGDGTVPLSCAELAGAETFYCRTAHDRMGLDPELALAVVDLLRTGHTRRYPDRCPAVSGARATQRESELLDTALNIDDIRDLFSGGFGSLERSRRSVRGKISLTVAQMQGWMRRLGHRVEASAERIRQAVEAGANAVREGLSAAADSVRERVGEL